MSDGLLLAIGIGMAALKLAIVTIEYIVDQRPRRDP